MTEAEIDELFKGWLAHAEARVMDQVEFDWAWEAVYDLRERPEELWQFIVATYNRPMSEKVQCQYAASPLEKLIAQHGARFIDRIEDLARTDPKFKEILGGVWQNCTPADIWIRIEEVRGEPWGP